MTRIFFTLALALFLTVFSIAQNETSGSDPSDSGCSQRRVDRDALIDEATRNELNTRRVEIAGSTYTRHREFAKRMVRGLNEGDIFTRSGLEKSVRRISRMKAIYPLTMDDVEIRLDRTDKSVDVVICVRQKPKR